MFGVHDCEVFRTKWYVSFLQRSRIFVKDGLPASFRGPSSAAFSFGCQLFGLAFCGFLGGFSVAGAGSLVLLG